MALQGDPVAPLMPTCQPENPRDPLEPPKLCLPALPFHCVNQRGLAGTTGGDPGISQTAYRLDRLSEKARCVCQGNADTGNCQFALPPQNEGIEGISGTLSARIPDTILSVCLVYTWLMVGLPPRI